MSGDFKRAYELQQQMLAEWIMGQKSYKETAMQLGMEVRKFAEDLATCHLERNGVLDNHTGYGNTFTTSPTLADHTSAIRALRKRTAKHDSTKHSSHRWRDLEELLTSEESRNSLAQQVKIAEDLLNSNTSQNNA